MGVHDLIIFGVDAADFDIIESEDLSLPTFERLMDSGSTAEMESTLPPITGAAWPSMACGRDPNDIEMFDFVNFSREERREYQPEPKRVDPFWSYLSEQGYSCGISGYPLAPLDKPVDGFVLSWPWYLPEDAPTLEPKGFFDNTDINVEDYIRPNTEFEFEQNMTDLKDKIRFDERVLSEFDFDVFYTYLDADTIIHMSTLNDLSGLHDIYRAVDEGIDRLLDYCDDDCTVLVVSDHGVSEMAGAFHMNNFLRDEGYLTLQSVATDGAESLKHTLASTASTVTKGLGVADFLRNFISEEMRSDMLGQSREMRLEEVDWDRTQVAMSGNWGQLFVFADREGPSVETVVNDLQQLAADHGMRLRDKYPAEEYHGKLHPDCPDAVVTFWDENDQLYLPNGALLREVESDSDYFQHRENGRLDQGEIGAFMAEGPDIASKDIEEQYHLLDVMPTVLNHVLGAVPPRVHGEVRNGIYDPDSPRAAEPDEKFAELQERLISDGEMEHGDMEEVREKLGDLGYFE